MYGSKQIEILNFKYTELPFVQTSDQIAQILAMGAAMFLEHRKGLLVSLYAN